MGMERALRTRNQANGRFTTLAEQRTEDIVNDPHTVKTCAQDICQYLLVVCILENNCLTLIDRDGEQWRVGILTSRTHADMFRTGNTHGNTHRQHTQATHTTAIQCGNDEGEEWVKTKRHKYRKRKTEHTR